MTILCMTDEQKQDEQEVIYEEDNGNDDADLDMDMAKEKIDKLKEKLKKCSKEKEEYLDGWQRSKAEMINYRRRQEEQMTEWLKMAQAGLINDLLPVLDTYYAREIYVKAGEEAGLWKNKELDGSDVIINQLASILKKHGLEEIKTVGEKFNPELHDAIEQVIKEGLEGIVIEEAQKGYLLNGKVLRTSKVKVSKIK